MTGRRPPVQSNAVLELNLPSWTRIGTDKKTVGAAKHPGKSIRRRLEILHILARSLYVFFRRPLCIYHPPFSLSLLLGPLRIGRAESVCNTWGQGLFPGGFPVDLMEHIPVRQVFKTLKSISRRSQRREEPRGLSDTSHVSPYSCRTGVDVGSWSWWWPRGGEMKAAEVDRRGFCHLDDRLQFSTLAIQTTYLCVFFF